MTRRMSAICDEISFPEQSPFDCKPGRAEVVLTVTALGGPCTAETASRAWQERVGVRSHRTLLNNLPKYVDWRHASSDLAKKAELKGQNNNNTDMSVNSCRVPSRSKLKSKRVTVCF